MRINGIEAINFGRVRQIDFLPIFGLPTESTSKVPTPMQQLRDAVIVELQIRPSYQDPEYEYPVDRFSKIREQSKYYIASDFFSYEYPSQFSFEPTVFSNGSSIQSEFRTLDQTLNLARAGSEIAGVQFTDSVENNYIEPRSNQVEEVDKINSTRAKEHPASLDSHASYHYPLGLAVNLDLTSSKKTIQSPYFSAEKETAQVNPGSLLKLQV